MLDPVTQTKFDMWRRKNAEGTLTREELKEAIAALRANRRTAAESSSSASRSKKGPARSADQLLSELDGL